MRYTKILSCLTVAVLSFSAVDRATAQGNQEAANATKEGIAASQARDWDKAVAAFKKATDLDQKYAANLAAALQQRAALKVSQQKFPEAVGDYSEALKIKSDANTLERRAYAFMQMKDYDKALGDYNEAIKLEPTDAKHYLLRSYIFEMKGDIKNGMADCDSILKLDPNNPEAMSRRMRFQKRVELSSHPTPPPLPTGPLANPALQKQGATSATPATAPKP